MKAELKFKDLCRFWEKVDVNSMDGCWNWNGNLTSDKGSGYRHPQFWLNDQKVVARRLSYLIHFGKILDGNIGDTCGNMLCVNPRHLLPVPERNAKTGLIYQTHKKRNKINEETARKVITLRKLGYTLARIQKKTGVQAAVALVIIKMANLCKHGKLKPYRVKTKV